MTTSATRRWAARIRWVERQFGGRRAPPEPGGVFTTEGVFGGYLRREPRPEHWSLRVTVIAAHGNSTKAIIWPLASEPPPTLLQPGDCFALLEGPRVIAVGTVGDELPAE